MPIQMRTVEFQVPGAVDGTTPAPRLSFDPKSPFYKAPDADGIVRFTAEELIELTGGNLGLFDPDFGMGGTFADRFLQLLEVVTAGAGPAARIDVVDAEDSTVQESFFAGAEANFYERDTLFIPQGSQLLFSGYTPTGAQPVIIRISVLAWDDIEDYAQLRTAACCSGGANPPAGDVGATFVYRPGGPAGDNIYNDFALLTTAVQAQAGPKWIEVDDTFVAIPLIPSGTFDLNGSVLQGRPLLQQTTLRGSVGSRLENVGGVQQNLQLQNNDPAAALVQLNALEFFDVRDGASLASLVASPVVEWSGAGAVVLRLQGARLQDLGLGPAFGVTGGAGNSAVLESYDGSVVDDDTLEIAVGSIVSVRVRDFGSDLSRTHALNVGTLAFGNIIASANAVPRQDNLMDSGLVTQRWRAMVSRVSLAAAVAGGGTAAPAYGALSVGRVSGVGYAIDPASVAQLQIANPASPQQSAVRAEGVARADIAGSVARIYASGIGASSQGYVRARTAHTGLVQALGIGSQASGYVNAWGYDARISATLQGSHAGGYALSYFPAGYGTALIESTERGAWAFGAASYSAQILASARGGHASGWAAGGPFVQGYAGIIRATLDGAFAHGHAIGGIVEGSGNGSTAFGVARTGLAGAPPSRISARGDGSLAGGWCFPSGLIEAGYSPTYGPVTFPGGIAWGAASDGDGGAGPATIRSLAHGAVAIGTAFGPNALLYAYNVGSFVFGYALSHLSTSYAEIRTLGDQGGCLAGGAASAHQTYTARISAEENGAFAWGVCGDAVNASAYIRAMAEGSFALGHADEGGTLLASGNGSMVRGQAQSPNGVGTATMTASGIGSLAAGRVLADSAHAGSILASGEGSLAAGLARTQGGASTIQATANGSMAFGSADYGNQISASAVGAVALGAAIYAAGGYVSASGEGSLAQGSAYGGNVIASARNAVQFGPGTNPDADSVRIGTAGIHMKGTVGAFGAYANGQFWIANGNVYCYSGNAVQNLTNVP